MTDLCWAYPNCLNVLSNAGFMVVGIMGLWFLFKKPLAGATHGFLRPAERLPYACFFVGVLFTCFGSGYYHWLPNDQTLVWDRLPMTVAFMGLLAAVIAERIDVRWGLRLLWPLLLAGAASVGWWAWRDNLWPYAAAQYLSILLIGLLMVLFTPRYSRSGDLLWVTGFYVLAKILEATDAKIFEFTHFVSGHTLKHLAATLAAYWILYMLTKRTPLAASSSQCFPAQVHAK